MKKTLIASSITLVLGTSATQAALIQDVLGPYSWSTDSANFTMLNAAGSTGLGSNDVNMLWDGNGYSASSDYTGLGSTTNVTMSTTTQWANRSWIWHDIQMFTPGSYSFDTSLGGGNPETGTLNVAVPSGQLGMHMLFDWGSNFNIDAFVVFAPSSMFGSGIARSTQQTTTYGSNLCDNGTIVNCLFDGGGFGTDGKPAGDKVWMLASVDGDGDGVMGIPMAQGGPFEFFNMNINANLISTPNAVVPMPPAIWLFGSGLLGLIGIARRKKVA